jgi:hypothetical protein
MAWIKGKVRQNNKKEPLVGYQPSHGPKKPIAPVGGSGVSKPIAKEGDILNEGFLPQKEKSIFPMLIQYTDTKEYATCKQPSDINVGKRFKIIKMDFK